MIFYSQELMSNQPVILKLNQHQWYNYGYKYQVSTRHGLSWFELIENTAHISIHIPRSI